MRVLRVALLAVASLAALLATELPVWAQAQTNWTGANSTDWFNASNWDNGVPDSSVRPTIDTRTSNPTVIDGLVSATASSFQLIVGETGTGSLTVKNGATYTSGAFAVLGDQSGSNGTLTVDGATWIGTAGSISVGNSGTGTLNIQNAAQGSVNGITVGVSSGSNGTVTVSGGSTVTDTGLLTVGSGGNGSLSISGGSTVSVGSTLQIGSSGVTGTVTVDGAGSSLTGATGIFIGFGGTRAR